LAAFLYQVQNHGASLSWFPLIALPLAFLRREKEEWGIKDKGIFLPKFFPYKQLSQEFQPTRPLN
jgi:hypothetical protein